MNGVDIAGLLQQAMAYRQANAKPVGTPVAIGMQAAQPTRTPMFINPRTAVQPQGMPTATNMGGGMGVANLMGQAMQYRSAKKSKGNRGASMANALRRSTSGAY